jgi:hypothetical protein
LGYEGVILVHLTPKGETVVRFPHVCPNEKALQGRRFSSDEEVSAAQNWLKTHSKNFFLMELQNF